MTNLDELKKKVLADLYPNDTGYLLTEAKILELVDHIAHHILDIAIAEMPEEKMLEIDQNAAGDIVNAKYDWNDYRQEALDTLTRLKNGIWN